MNFRSVLSALAGFLVAPMAVALPIDDGGGPKGPPRNDPPVDPQCALQQSGGRLTCNLRQRSDVRLVGPRSSAWADSVAR